MQEIIAQALTFLWGIWRHKWLALVIAWVVALAGWVYVWKLPEAYVGSAKLHVDTNTVLRPLLRGLAITPDINQRVRMMSSTLFSRPNLEKLARMTDLDLQATTDIEKEELISDLRKYVSLRGQRGNASLYNVRVQHEDRETARRITQSMITVFIESSLNEKRDDSSGAQSFLDEQIADYERRLIESEGRLARFKQQNVDVLPGSGGDYYSRLDKVRGQLKQARLNLEEMQNRRDELNRQLSGDGGALAALVSQDVLTPTGARIQELRVRMDSLLTRYTELHPEVRQIKALMGELEDQRDEEIQALREGGASPESIASNPIYQDMRAMLTESEAKVAELKVRVNEYQRREEELARKVNQIPEIEAQLKQLDRDYGVVKSRHNELLQRRESVRLSQGVEDNASDVTFRVIDPPFVPRNPSEPNKVVLNSMVLVLALGAGAAAALLVSLLRPIVVDARMLSEATGLPLLGVVTYNKDKTRLRQDRWKFAVFASCVLALVGVYTAVLMAPQIVARIGAFV
ncbi:MAG: XrtA system polysaccharide chain length determinant [Pseudomonadota bacterium]